MDSPVKSLCNVSLKLIYKIYANKILINNIHTGCTNYFQPINYILVRLSTYCNMQPIYQPNVTVDETQKWKTQISGKGGVISAFIQRLFFINSLKNQVSKNQLRKIAESIWTSKLRYGLQLYGEVRQKCQLN